MKRKWILIVVIAVVIGAAAYALLSGKGPSVQAVKVQKTEVESYVQDVGTVQCKTLFNVGVEGTGLIKSISADIGQQVKKGDILLVMDTSQLELQLQDAGQKINEIEALIKGAKETDTTSDAKKAEIAVDQANSAYQAAKAAYDNAKALYGAGATSQADLDAKKDTLDRAKAALDTADVDYSRARKETTENTRAAYQAQLEQAKINEKSIKDKISRQTVVSPADGTVLERNAEVNTIAAPGTVAFVIGNTEDIEIEMNILADEASDVRIGDDAEITLRSRDKAVISGKVTKVAPSAVTIVSSLGVNQKRVLVTIKPDQAAKGLKPGYEEDVRLITQKKDGVLAVPVGAVFDYNGKSCVFVMQDGKAVLHTIEKGISDERYAEVANGLKEGETVLAGPDDNIADGMKVNATIGKP